MRLLRDASGAVMAEYGLVLALLSFAFMGGMYAVERAAHTTLHNVQAELLDYGLRNGS